MKKKIVVLGSTGSIGRSALEIIKKRKKSFVIDTLIAHSNYKIIKSQITLYRPKNFIITNRKIFEIFKKSKNVYKTRFYNSIYDLEYKKKIDLTISAIPGLAGLPITIFYAKISNKLLLANKESIICGWSIINKIVKKNKIKLIPIDSEHFSVKKILDENKIDKIDKIFITASGGPFFKKNMKNKKVLLSDALKHPKWKMGKKISIDSATMLNKVFELIEAKKLFPRYKKKFDILLHPQSLIHAIVKFENGLQNWIYHEPDMKIPIANAIFDSKINIKDFIKLNYKSNEKKQELQFFKINKYNFPPYTFISKIDLYKSFPIILNAVNEVFVDLFLKNKIKFNSIIPNIVRVIKNKNFKKYAIQNASNLKKIYEIDNWSRKIALAIAKK